jgi:hypothetical protein
MKTCNSGTAKQVLPIAIATLVALLANSAIPAAKAYDVVRCEAESALGYIDQNGQSGYYAAGEQFNCTTPDGDTLVGLKNGVLVVVVNGLVTINGTAVMLQNGQGRPAYENANSSYSRSSSGMSTSDYIDSATYDYGYRTDYGNGTGGYIDTYQPSYPY